MNRRELSTAHRWGRTHRRAWLVALPVVLALGGCVSDEEQVTVMEKKTSEKNYATDGATVQDTPETPDAEVQHRSDTGAPPPEPPN
jgi:hypothetical protein